MVSSADKLESPDRNQYSGTAVDRAMSERAFDIEKRSFDIIESEIGGHSYDEYQWVIVRRVIHATADFDFAKSGKILFHKRAIESAFNALQRRCTIVTDVDMVNAAISKKSMADLGSGRYVIFQTRPWQSRHAS